jgi:hypothetical protein
MAETGATAETGAETGGLTGRATTGQPHTQAPGPAHGPDPVKTNPSPVDAGPGKPSPPTADPGPGRVINRPSAEPGARAPRPAHPVDRPSPGAGSRPTGPSGTRPGRRTTSSDADPTPVTAGGPPRPQATDGTDHNGPPGRGVPLTNHAGGPPRSPASGPHSGGSGAPLDPAKPAGSRTLPSAPATATGAPTATAPTTGVTHTWNPFNGPGPLGEETASTFRSSTYTQTTLTHDTTLYRAYGGTAGPLGRYWSDVPPAGPLQTQVDSALNPAWGNTADHVSTIRVPAGTEVFIGVAAPQPIPGGSLIGGGSQVYIPRVDPAWLVP